MTPIIIDENLTNETPQESQPVAYEFKPASEEPPPDSEARKAEELKNFAEFLDMRQDEINKRRESLDEREQKLLRREQESETALLRRQSELIDATLNECQKVRAQERQKLDGELATLRQAAAEEIDKLYATSDAELKQRRDALTAELNQKREALTAELDQKRDALTAELNQKRDALTAELNQKREALTAELNQKRDALTAELNQKRDALDEATRNLADEKSALERERKNLEFDKLSLKKFDETLKERQANIDSAIAEGVDDRYKSLEAKFAAAQEQEKNLIATLTERERELATYQNFRAIYGDTPEILMQKMKDLRDRNAALVEELGTRPGEELQSDYARLEEECKSLQQERDTINKQLTALQGQFVELQTLRNENTILKTAKENLKGLWEDAQETITGLQTRIDRLTAAEITPADWDKRAASLHEPYLTEPFNAPQISAEDAAQVDEIAWLDRLETLFNEYGITFPRRILYAFHTSFKIANWSTLTVLAGVSGTGKSELPRLYSAFGGFNFITVPVQPNWDSQESMLGFFNSIDNKFDAQPVLRFLVECTETYENNMAIVLLDEMNLAHVEHYFADFLSKLETRRSLPESNVPEIYVNLGAGFKPYGLPLKRNVLWCGTMNQDETTKSLSDKVLDRGIIINFPRPRELKSREGAKNLKTFFRNQNYKPQPMSKQLWSSWQTKQIGLAGEQRKELERYRHMLEEMNEYLSHAGRAIGHRVWQSIEHYVINYPTVRAAVRNAGNELTSDLSAAIHTAVEDQIVQKVMPKLRGIDTRGKSYEKCLAPIKGRLHDAAFNLDDDFDRACEMGYGQFMWSSAEYISEDGQ